MKAASDWKHRPRLWAFAAPGMVGTGLPDVPEISDVFLAPRVSHGEYP